MIVAVHDAVTGRRGFPVFLTLVIVAFWLLRVLYPDAPSNDDVKEQIWMNVDWRLGYGSGANPPLFTWLVRLVDSAVGATIVSAEIVRFALLWLFCFLSADVLRRMTGDGRLAALGGLAPLAVYAVGWEALFRHSNTMLLIVSIPMTLAALLRLDRRDGPGSDWTGYLVFAAATAFGFYSKYNYAIVWGGFVGAALLDARLRARLLDRRMIGAFLVGVLLLSPLLYWVAGHLDGMLSHGRLRLDQRPNFPLLPPRISALADLAASAGGLMVPLFAILLALCPRAFGRVRDAGDMDRTRWRRLLARYLLIVGTLLIAGVFALGMVRFQTRYVYVLLPVLPLVFLRLAAAGFGGRRRQWFAAALVAVILLVMAGTAFRSVTYAARKASAAVTQPAGHDPAINHLLTGKADALATVSPSC